MQKDTVVLWAKYNKTINEIMNGFIKTLRPDEWNKQLGGFFKSVRELCSHLYIADFSWLKRFGNLREFNFLKDSFFEKNLSFNVVLFENIDEYLAKRLELDTKMCAFAAEIQDEDLGKMLRYTNSQGESFEKNAGGLIMHIFNHDTHHRGMISLYLELLERENDFCSFNRVL
ncbi:MAG: DinB family protein [Spirochaetaceae bacterium]|jgi:uncharacterized damage-inducible protein DinB|nr:DinB family protein [Spirochaetaceae bacterium]